MRADDIEPVMSDQGLPDGSGLVLMSELSAKYGLRGIALSGYGMKSDRVENAAAGFSHHFTPPVSATAHPR